MIMRPTAIKRPPMMALSAEWMAQAAAGAPAAAVVRAARRPYRDLDRDMRRYQRVGTG